MSANAALRLTIDMGKFICTSYLADLTDDDVLRRPHPDCNHINWQLGHLILAEHGLVEGQFPGSMPRLPQGFAERYGRESAKSNDPGDFVFKSGTAGGVRVSEPQHLLRGFPSVASSHHPNTGETFTVIARFEVADEQTQSEARLWA